jgi:DNA-directed RNA polymerase subunit RPC12/RpoP
MSQRARHERRLEGCPECDDPDPVMDCDHGNMQDHLYARCQNCGYRTDEVWLVPRWEMMVRIVRRWNLEVTKSRDG